MNEIEECKKEWKRRKDCKKKEWEKKNKWKIDTEENGRKITKLIDIVSPVKTRYAARLMLLNSAMVVSEYKMFSLKAEKINSVENLISP